MNVIKLARRAGKTTKCLDLLRDNDKSIMFSRVGLRIDHPILNENPEIKKRIFDIYTYQERVRGMNVDMIIIDDGDLIPTSVLLEMINLFIRFALLVKNCQLIITTTD